MNRVSSTAPPTPRNRGLFRRSRGEGVSPAHAASRISAFVYGNILVMAALIALHPQDLAAPKAIAYVAGTGFSTFLAHVLAELVGMRVETDRRPTLQDLRHELRDSVPIVSSATFPLLMMAATLLGWLDPSVALPAAIGVTVLRLGGLGFVVGRLRRHRLSARTFVGGVLLAVFCLGAAILKAWLTH